MRTVRGPVNMPAAIVFAVLVIAGLVANYLKSDILSATLIAAALGQLGPSPFRNVGRQ